MATDSPAVDPIVNTIRDALYSAKIWLDTDDWKEHKDATLRTKWVEMYNQITEAFLHVESLNTNLPKIHRALKDSLLLEYLEALLHQGLGEPVLICLPLGVSLRQMLTQHQENRGPKNG